MIEPFVVILPGAGSGLRFNSDTPKQFQRIEGKLVIDYSIDLFLTFNECKRIIIHGVLHLIGYKDDTIKNKKIMDDLEEKFLKIDNKELIKLSI